MEGDEGLRTVECLRGRLLAERAASRAANNDSEHITKKVIELEKQLKMEIKSRNKAEKRLKFLMKKLDSLNISYVSDESSNISEKSEISSVSSSNISKLGKRHNCPSHEHNFGSFDEAISAYSGSKSFVTLNNDNEEKSTSTSRNDEDEDDVCDNSMALIVIDSTVKEEKKDVTILNGNVKDVLDALRYAKECLQASMDMRRHVKPNIVQPRLDRISC